MEKHTSASVAAGQGGAGARAATAGRFGGAP